LFILSLLMFYINLLRGKPTTFSKIKKISIEESVMISPISIGVIYDYYHDICQFEGSETISNQFLTGLQFSFYPISYWKNYDKSSWSTFNLFLNVYLAYNFQKEFIHITYTDKKDMQIWANY